MSNLFLIDLENILKLFKKKNPYYGQSSTNYNFLPKKKVQTIMLGPFKLGYITKLKKYCQDNRDNL